MIFQSACENVARKFSFCFATVCHHEFRYLFTNLTSQVNNKKMSHFYVYFVLVFSVMFQDRDRDRDRDKDRDRYKYSSGSNSPKLAKVRLVDRSSIQFT